MLKKIKTNIDKFKSIGKDLKRTSKVVFDDFTEGEEVEGIKYEPLRWKRL